MPKTKAKRKVRTHADIALIERVLQTAIESETSEALAVYPDVALVELCRRAGVKVTVNDVNYFRRRLSYAGIPTRIRKLIGETK